MGDVAYQRVPQAETGLSEVQMRAVVRDDQIQITIMEWVQVGLRGCADIPLGSPDRGPFFGNARAFETKALLSEERVRWAVLETHVDPGIDGLGDVSACPGE